MKPELKEPFFNFKEGLDRPPKSPIPRILKTLSNTGLIIAVGAFAFAAFSHEVMEEILANNKYTCQSCGQKGGLNSDSQLRMQAAHFDHSRNTGNGKGQHKDPYDHPKNGRTLCILCHTKEHIEIAHYQMQHNELPWINAIIAQIKDIIQQGIYYNHNLETGIIYKQNFEESISFLEEIALQLAELGIIIRRKDTDANGREKLIAIGGTQAEQVKEHTHIGQPLRPHLTITTHVYDPHTKQCKQHTFYILLTAGAERALKYYRQQGSPNTKHIPRLDYQPKPRETRNCKKRHNKPRGKHRKK